MKKMEIRIVVDEKGMANIIRDSRTPAIEIALVLSQVVVQLTAQAMSEAGTPALAVPTLGQIKTLRS